LLLLLAGLLGGFVNVVAGGGTLLTVPALLALGLDPGAANATARLAIWTQSTAATATFWRSRDIPWAQTRRLLPASLLGALAGAWLATRIDPDQLRLALAVIFLGLSAHTLRDLFKPSTQVAVAAHRPAGASDHAVFGLLGVYGGFVQAGVGLLFAWAGHRLSGLTPARANGMKSVMTLGFATGALVVFALDGAVRWRDGLPLAVGGLLGGILGARYGSQMSVRVFKVANALGAALAGGHFAGWF
jgi:uncharacterized membrane protein YfcA